MDMMMMLLLLMMLPNLLGGLGNLFGGGGGTQSPTIYIDNGANSGPPDKDSSYNATYNPDSGVWDYVPSNRPDEDEAPPADNPFDLAIGGAIIGAGIGAWFSPLTLGLSIGAGGIIGGGIGLVADIFI